MRTPPPTIRVRGGSGFGDSLYLRPVAEYLMATNPQKQIIPLTNYPDIFMGSGLCIEPHRKTMYDVLAHYTTGRPNTSTNQWQDILYTAKVPPDLPLKFYWNIQNENIVRHVRKAAHGKPIILLNGGRPPMGRTDGYSDEMLPFQEAFLKVLRNMMDCFFVKVGKGPELYELPYNIDLSNNTTPGDVLDLAKSSDLLVGQCSFMVPLAEVFDKPFLGVWARAGLNSRNDFIRQCTPSKILAKPATSLWVVDDWPQSGVNNVVAQARNLFEANRELHHV